MKTTSNHKILVVDDSETILIRMVDLLTRGGYTVVKANDGDVALEIIKNSQDFAMIITDFNMPRVDGLTLVEEIRKLASYKSTPIIMLTTETDNDIISQSDIFEVTWMNKPVKEGPFLQAMRETLPIQSSLA